MDSAIISPIKLLTRIDKVFTPGFHICYSSLIHEYKPYRDFYRNRSRKGETVLLDYSHITPRDIDGIGKVIVLKASVEYIKPTAVILPDSDLHTGKTLNSAVNTLKFLTYQLGQVPVIAMVQGISEDQLVECLDRYKELSKQYKIVGIGLPSAMEKIIPRHKFITDIYNLSGLNLPLYLVEVFDSMREVMATKLLEIDSIVGGWSTLPTRLAFSEKVLTKEGKIRPSPDPLDYLEEDIPELILDNLITYKEVYS